jgi:hypothetical protein
VVIHAAISHASFVLSLSKDVLQAMRSRHALRQAQCERREKRTFRAELVEALFFLLRATREEGRHFDKLSANEMG